MSASISFRMYTVHSKDNIDFLSTVMQVCTVFLLLCATLMPAQETSALLGLLLDCRYPEIFVNVSLNNLLSFECRTRLSSLL